MTNFSEIPPELEPLRLVKMPTQQEVLAWADFTTLPRVRTADREAHVSTKLLEGALALVAWSHHHDLGPEKGMGARKLAKARKHKDEWLIQLSSQVDPPDFAEFIEALVLGWIKRKKAPKSDALIILDFATTSPSPQLVRVLGTWLHKADKKLSNFDRKHSPWKLPEEIAELAGPLLKSFAFMETPDSLHALVTYATLARSGVRRAQARAILDEYCADRSLDEWELGARIHATLGLDDDAPVRHDLQTRVLELRIDDTGHVHVTDAKSKKTYKKFPSIKKHDHSPSYYKAKRHHDALSRDVSALFEMHRLRLLRALMTQRSWSIAQWHEHIGRHRLLAPSTRSIVWRVTRADKTEPIMVLSDGEGGFFDIQTETVQFLDDARITVAHPVDIPDDAQKVWLGHLADFEVLRTIDQFERLTFPRQRAIEVITGSPQKLHRDTVNALCEEAWDLGSVVKNKGYKGHYYTANSISLSLDVGKLVLDFSPSRPLKLDTQTLRPRSAKSGPLEWRKISLGSTPRYIYTHKGVVEDNPPDTVPDAALSELARLLFLGDQNRSTNQVQFHVSG